MDAVQILNVISTFQIINELVSNFHRSGQHLRPHGSASLEVEKSDGTLAIAMETGQETPASGRWPVDPQEDVPISKERIWVDGCFDFAHHGNWATTNFGIFSYT